MRIIRTVKEMHSYSESFRKAGKTLSLVPTMGFLHEGHLSLMREAKKKSDVLVVSVFVNPIQFGPGEDYDAYPRNFERDREMVEAIGCDCIYAPKVSEMYPDGYQTSVQVDKVIKNLCGTTRPTHFNGVTTVVAKLFNAVKPHLSIFGEKDFQQLIVIKRMVFDLNMDIDVIGMPIVREEDGLAMSSRNKYLTPDERMAALCLSQSLFEAKKMFEAGERSAEVLIDHVKNIICSKGTGKIDYIKICDVVNLEDCFFIEKDSVMALAVYFNKARLIDNIVLTTG
jgi:pantoate--beta-alanine ligase